jgi:hypothetical protein
MNKERNVFNKLIWRFKLFEKIKHLNGDIVECGIFKGSGLFTWLKLISLEQPHSIKKVIGFDFFDSSFVENLENEQDKTSMSHVFLRSNNLSKSEISIEDITKKCINSNFDTSKFELIKGDISVTSLEYIRNRPGFRISLLYLDMDLDKPTYDSLCVFWDRIVPGGIIVFDEYAYHNWSESNGVDRFLKGKNLNLLNTHIATPTAYIIKP